MIEFLDPRGETGTEIQPYTLSVKLNGSNSATVGLLANGFPDSDNFLNHVAAVLNDTQPGLSLEHFNKGNASAPASPEMLNSISESCQALVTAYGHWGSCTTGTVRDGISAANLGIPAVALVTEEFWPQGDFVAKSLGMPDVPRVKLPHPIAGTGEANMRRIAEEMTPLILAALEAQRD